jgi:hypothetical protein
MPVGRRRTLLRTFPDKMVITPSCLFNWRVWKMLLREI